MSEEPRKRNRKSTSCYTCRKRKTRCDRNRPFCGRCVLDKCTDSCTYDDGEAQDVSQQTEVEELKRRIAGLESIITQNNALAGVDTPASKVEFSNLSIHEREDHSKRGTSVDRVIGEKASGYSSSSSMPSNSEFTPRDAVTQGTGPDSVPPFDGFAIVRQSLMYMNPTSAMSLGFREKTSRAVFRQLGVVVDSKPNPIPSSNSCFGESDLIDLDFDKEIGRLPPFEVLEAMVKHFFSGYRSFVPFLDDDIVSELFELIESKNGYCIIRTAKANRSSLIAMLLIVLRFTYLLNPSVANGFVFSEHAIVCASEILITLSSYRHVSIMKLQGLLLLKVYRRHCVEADDSTDVALILNSVIISTARILGVDKPSIGSKLISVDEQKLRDKCWKYVCYFDSSLAFNTGSFYNVQPFEIKEDSNDLSLMCEISKVLVDFNGSLPTVERSTLLDTLQRVSIISNQKTLNQVLSYKNGDTSKAAHEFEIRLDLVYKEFVLYYLLSFDDNNEKDKYLALAFERALIILRVLHEHTTTRTFFSVEVDKFLSPQIWLNARQIVVPITNIFHRVLQRDFSIVQTFKYFNSPDSSGLMTWVEVDFASEINTLTNIVKKIQEIFSNGSLLAPQFYPAFKACMFIRSILEIFTKEYPEFMSQVNNEESETFGWRLPELPYTEVEDSWFKKDDMNTLYSVDRWFSNINEDIDKLFSELNGYTEQ